MSSTFRRKENLLSPYAISFFSGLALSFSFPRHDLFFLAWFALAPFIFTLSECSYKEAFKSGIFFGVPFFFGTQYWIYHSVNMYGNIPFIPSLSIILLLCLYESLYIAFFGVLLNYTVKESRLPTLFIAPLLWVCLEFARGRLLTGFPWSFVGHSQYSLLPLIQIADITGVYGISFIIIAVNCVIADLLILNKKRKNIPLYPAVAIYFGAFVFFIVLILSIAYGYFRLSQESPGGELHVSVIQGNIEQDKKWDPAYRASVFSTYLSLTEKASETKPDLIVWPETSVPFMFGTDKDYTIRLLEFQKKNKIPLLFGSIMAKSIQGGRYTLTNSAIHLDADGKVASIYDKIHLVPFGEYVPLKKIIFFVDKLVEGIGDYKPGSVHTVSKTSIGSFPTVICYELVFPSLVRKFFSKGGDFLVTITNDAWFGKTSGPYQHFYSGVFRAIENRKPLIRAANSGISGFIDSRGRVLKKSDLFKQQIIDAVIKKDPRSTFYTKYGDIFIYLCLITVAVIILNLLFRTKSYIGGKRW